MKAYDQGANVDELKQILGRGRAKLGMFVGDLDEGELEVGQVSAMMDEIKPAAQIVEELIDEFEIAKNQLVNVCF